MVNPSRLPAVSAVDRLTLLPDDILYIIMSLLPVRQAVQTCVLSRRWKGLWRSMPCLSIDEQEFDTASSGARGSSRFEEFVNSLLRFHQAPSLDMFRFHVTKKYEPEVVKEWFRRGIERCPIVVEISRSGSPIFYENLPYLGSRAFRLKKLHLVGITLDSNFTTQLPSYCPVLEDLKLDRCRNLLPPEISSCTLKNLIVRDCSTWVDNAPLNITAPNLVSFHLEVAVIGWSWGSILVNEMLSLANATICLKQESGRSNPPRRPCKLLCSLTNVRNLMLSGLKTLLILDGETDTFPTFPNLRTLLLDGCDLSDDFQMLGRFMNSAPSLEKLTLEHCKLPEGPKKRKIAGNRKRLTVKCLETLSFQCTNLKLTEIKYQEDDIHLLFGLLNGIWRNLQKSTIVLTKASRI